MLLFTFILLLLPWYSYSGPVTAKKTNTQAKTAAQKSGLAVSQPQTNIATPAQASTNAQTEPRTKAATAQLIESAKTVTIANNITDDMITYKGHITGPHKPTSFSTYVNGTEIKPGTTSHIPRPENKKLQISCKYEFKKGWVHVKKEREKEITLDPHDEQLNVLFSWDSDDRIIVQKSPTEKKSTPNLQTML